MATNEALFASGNQIIAEMDKYNKIHISVIDHDGKVEIYGSETIDNWERIINETYTMLNNCEKVLVSNDLSGLTSPFYTIFEEKAKDNPFLVRCEIIKFNDEPVTLYCSIESAWRAYDFQIIVGEYQIDDYYDIRALGSMRAELIKDIKIAKKEITALL